MTTQMSSKAERALAFLRKLRELSEQGELTSFITSWEFGHNTDGEDLYGELMDITGEDEEEN